MTEKIARPNLWISGANGFVGKALCAEAIRRGFAVKGAVRRQAALPAGVVRIELDTLTDEVQLAEKLHDVDVVIHLAARVHVMQEQASDPLAAFREVNTLATEKLARAAAAQGVKRFVFVSTIKVNGEETRLDRAYTENDVAHPLDPYGISKWEAEQVLHKVAAETGLEIVIVRPPLVYGSGVKGNFAQLIAVVQKGWFLPLASVRNSRSMLYLGNFVDALLLCATHPAASGKTYLLSDGEDLSTPGLLRQLAQAMGRQARLFSAPAGLLRLAGRLLGRSAQIERLTGSLKVDCRLIKRELDWRPPYSVQQGMRATVQSSSNDDGVKLP